MRLESAFLSSREGLISQGQAISVVGDNIANANTTAFKRSRAEFQDLLSDGERQSSAIPSSGNGSVLSQVRQDMSTGVLEFTGRQLDTGIEGNGFFLVGDAAAPQYSRAGNFSIGSDGILKSASGDNLIGYSGIDTTTLGSINMRNVNVAGSATTAASLIGNIDSGSAITSVLTALTSFNELRAQASFVTNTIIYDSLGAQQNLTLGFFKTGVNTYAAQAYIDGGSVTGGVAGVPVAVGGTPAQLAFSSNGAILEANQAAAVLTAAPVYAGGAAVGAVTIDLSQFTQYASPNSLYSADSDGSGNGNITGYEFRTDGGIFAQLDSGSSVQLGTIALASFVNPEAMQRSGSSNYIAGSDVGERTVSVGGSGGTGKIQGGSLERSTVDIADEFVNLVVFQRGYQASSQTLNATNELLKSTIALIR